MTHLHEFSFEPKAIKRSNQLATILKQQINESHGSISFSTFMEMALYYPSLGYYHAEEICIGKEGDFITAPEISPLFAQCFAKQSCEILSQLKSPSFLELGAGSGQFAKDILFALHERNCLPHRYYIYEISPTLQKKQQHFLQLNCPFFFDQIIWLDSLPDNFIGIIFANEIIDALPVHCFQLRDNEIKEKCVALKNNEFVFHLKNPSNPLLNQQVDKLNKRYQLSSDYVSEVQLSLSAFIKNIAQTLREGVIFFVDYGYGEAEYYHPDRNQGTLTTFYRHKKYTNPLWYPGLFDITAHVDFTRVVENAILYDCELAGFTTQAAFLLSCGLLNFAEAAEKKLSPKDQFLLHQSIKLLTLPTEMGECIKVMALTKQFNLPLIGFRFQDRRRDL